MANANENFADILAEMRSIQPDDFLLYVDSSGNEQSLRSLADRIEAAVKRERDEWFSGNPVSMRTALIQCELFLGNIERHGHSKLNPGDECVACKGASELRSQVNAAIDAPNHAKLGNDAPARNVDKLETKEAALAALKKRFPVEENFAGFKMAVEWLLDTQDFCLAWPVSHRFGTTAQKGGAE